MTDYADIGPVERRRTPIGPLLVVIAAVLVVLGGIFGALFFLTADAPVLVPRLSGVTVADASKLLADKRLVDGNAYYAVTTQFPQGYVIGQTPAPGSRVKAGSAVNIRVAVPPRSVAIPDLHLYDLPTAKSVLATTLVQPVVLYAYSKQVETGRVIEQLPRAGDTAMTGSAEYIVLSLGPGKSGATVPSAIGLMLGPARSAVASATLFANARPVEAPGISPGMVVDQAPSAGSIVPATSQVVLSYSIVR